MALGAIPMTVAAAGCAFALASGRIFRAGLVMPPKNPRPQPEGGGPGYGIMEKLLGGTSPSLELFRTRA